jgi:hypothetical protein
MADPSNLYLLPRREEGQENHNNPSSRKREEVEPSYTSTEKSTLSSAGTSHKKARGNKSSTIARYWWRQSVSRPIPMVRAADHLHSGRLVAQLRPPGQVPAPCRSGDLREPSKEGLSGRGKQHQHHLPRTLQGLGVPLKELHESDAPFFGIVPTEGEYPT